MENLKMKTKNVLVSFLTITCVLFLVATVSAYSGQYVITDVEVEGISVFGNTPAITAGETIQVEVKFYADFDCSSLSGDEEDECMQDFDVTVEVEIDTGKKKITEVSRSMYIEDGDNKRVVLSLKIPNELKDDLGELVDLEIEVDGEQYRSNTESFELKVERTLYEADIKSVSVNNKIEAGESFPVDIVVKNTGAGDLDDLYVRVSISALGIQKSAYFGDLVAIEDGDDDDETDTVSGRLYLQVPYDVAAGIYTLDVEVVNDDTVSTAVRQVVIENDFSNAVIATTLRKSAMANEEVSYDLLIVNPTNKLMVYRVITESSGSLSSSTNSAVIAIGAGSSEIVKVTASADSEGEYNFNVNVISGDSILETVPLTLKVEESQVTNPVIILTIVLAIIFLVLLVVLIVLLGKKPEKSEEFGESYY